ncbi:UTP--glucose-1-phosphate uridylyltransferase [Gemmata obscuriglobus]|uniref:UTP--glucose-1-phosphate uridylyltransferase n=1 Tax=Gemmata obscuriglobus TaxID=114 RepID=A0A2Z3H410_9BACT|nr:UTP--glucose-1-phosphate uridylyltransferase [Gemmata obscuriglobus]AWM39591.1 UTP--glucose-1-phosphate uridylyltransferase [Gemmata obscuriglobus]QEG27310.1 UTP--glucose-1-phosphate uridylyltransferase [Gemmata obscuriglobus]VTS04135.1 utp--glucose-1-phosphate uridylyltransferase : UTP--glucose-1-phosphate uridylyltransferase-like protein OS=Chthoniobacter flavus Ellin428 GN=CfE428DRAFT_0194 PE=4 SV=1: UDPGP [Gemmata obscuriglobus UQM 2246]
MPLSDLITSADPAVRNTPLAAACRALGYGELLAERDALDRFRRDRENLYERVRALFFLYAIDRFHLPARPELPAAGRVPYAGVERLMGRRFDEAVRLFRAEEAARGPSDPLCSALAAAYHALAFQTLADQVRASVRGAPGNRWMFRTGSADEHPLRVRPELLARSGPGTPFPVLRERTPVRMDLSHSCWSDIFFLGMDYPEGARVLNVSIDLGVNGRDAAPRPPIEVYFRVIDEPVLRLVSVDLDAAADVRSLDEVFDFARDYLGLLKAAVIASGLIPPGLEGVRQELGQVLEALVGPGLGIELVSVVNDIPKGSRLAVSTNLLAALIAVCMRTTGQAKALTGGLSEPERRLVAARAILGEWIGGSGGGWQDSGGVWPGIKLIEGAAAAEGDPEFGVSRGCLLPRHTVLGPDRVPPDARRRLEDSLVLVHGGMAQNVGPVLEMVTEKYLLREEREWAARQEALGFFDEIVGRLERGEVRALGAATTRNFGGPIQTIIPAATNAFTEALIASTRAHFGTDFWGFWMLGGMSGGGMGFIVAPERKPEAQRFLLAEMSRLRGALRTSLPFAMEPVVYDFAINPRGTAADLLPADESLLPRGYYALLVPRWLREDPRAVPASKRAELDRVGRAARRGGDLAGLVESLFDRMLPSAPAAAARSGTLTELLAANGFDREQHERVRADLRRGLIGLAQNRLPASTVVEDVKPGDVSDARAGISAEHVARGRAALEAGEAAVVTLAAGAGSRWTQGAGVVKALHPFVRLAGRHRTFLEIHLAKSRRVSDLVGAPVPHVFTTGYLTHEPIRAHLDGNRSYVYPGPVRLSPGASVGLRLVPMERDLRFAWEETAHQVLDERKQRVRESAHAALIGWAKAAGEGADYTDNEPPQCLHPVGHWYEVPNLLLNGTLRDLLAERPRLKYLLVHNVDTLGAALDPGVLGLHIASGRALTYEVIGRRIDDRGGGLARVDGKVRIVEGLAMPREEEEFNLTFYNTLTTWVDIDQLLTWFGLTRADLADAEKVGEAIGRMAPRLPTYVTLKDVKKRWGHGQEDVYPVCQFEKLWGDMTAVGGVDCGFVAVPRPRGQQLKDPAQLDGWLRDGSADAIASLCAFSD